MLLGWVEPGDLPPSGYTGDYTPLGSSASSMGSFQSSPNATVLLRDLFVRVQSPPGLGTRWEFSLQGPGAEALTCSIASAAATTCDSGGQTVTIPAGKDFRLQIE